MCLLEDSGRLLHSFNLELLGNYHISSVPGHCEAQMTSELKIMKTVKLGICHFTSFKFMGLCTYI